MTAELVIAGGQLAAPVGSEGPVADPVDVVIDGERISAVVPAGQAPAARRTLDASDSWVMPGFVDIQVHFRTPGATDSEDMTSGAAGAAMGGVTACVIMPNTNPPIDTPDMVTEVLALASGVACDVRTSAAITAGRAGERLTDLTALYDAGVRVFTDDGDCVADDALMHAALAATVRLPGAVISQHAEDPAMVAGGVVNAGAVAERLGVRGRPAEPPLRPHCPGAHRDPARSRLPPAIHTAVRGETGSLPAAHPKILPRQRRTWAPLPERLPLPRAPPTPRGRGGSLPGSSLE